MIGIGLNFSMARQSLPPEALGTKIYADFASGIFAENGVVCQPDALFTCARSTLGGLYDGTQFIADTMRIGARGLLVEGASTNYVLNSFAPANQVIELDVGTYTVSVSGSGSLAISGDATNTVTEIAGASFTLGASGSVTLTITGSLDWIQVEDGAFATSPIQTAGTTATRNSDDVQFANPGDIALNNTAITVEWEQMQVGTSVDNILRWTQPEGWSRLRAGSATVAQVLSSAGSLGLNHGLFEATPVGIHNFDFTSNGSGMTIAWGDTLNGSAGSGSTTSTTFGSAPTKIQLGGSDVSESLNGFIRKLVVT